MQVIDALPLQWRNSLALHGQKGDKTFVLKDHIKLRLKDQEVSIDKAASKHIYAEIRSKYERLHRGFKHSKTVKALGLRPRAFISFLVFETPMKHSHSFFKYYLNN